MSYTIRSSTLRTLAAAGLLGGARLVAPAITQAQVISTERGLLNYSVAAITFGPRFLEAVVGLDGERALLGSPAGGPAPALDPRRTVAGSATRRPVDGERVLRNVFSTE